MHADTVTEKAGASGSGQARRSVITRWSTRFRLALSRTRPYILAAVAIYVGAFLVTIMLRAGVVLPEDRWLLHHPIVPQPVNLEVGFAEWAYVFQHNLVADVVGIATGGVPGILINAYGLGESAASAHAAGWAGTFWSVILPHGPLEIATHSVALGVGLRFGGGLLARVRRRVDRRGGIRGALADGFVLMLGLVVPATAVAALIEVELSTMLMPLPFAALFGIFAGGTLVALILGIQGPEPGTVAAERGSAIDEHVPTPVVDGGDQRPIPEEDIARARSMLREIAEGEPALDLLWKPAPRDVRAACARIARRGQLAPDPITAAVVAGSARRYLSFKFQAIWIGYVLSMSLLIAVTGARWFGVAALLIVGAVLSLSTRRRVTKMERVNRELVDKAVLGVVPIPLPSASNGIGAGFWRAIHVTVRPSTTSGGSADVAAARRGRTGIAPR